jgi:hypothetical protein
LGLLLLTEATTARRHIFFPSHELEEQTVDEYLTIVETGLKQS